MACNNTYDIYDDAETARMGEAFRAAWDYVEQSGSHLAHPCCLESSREQLASAIIHCVRHSAPSVEALRDAALQRLGFVILEIISLPEILPELSL